VKYCRCDYCGRPTAVNPEYHLHMPYCNMGCEVNFAENGPLSEGLKEQHYAEALPEFEEKLRKWREGALRRWDGEKWIKIEEMERKEKKEMSCSLCQPGRYECRHEREWREKQMSQEMQKIKAALKWLDATLGCEHCSGVAYHCELYLKTEEDLTEEKEHAKVILELLK